MARKAFSNEKFLRYDRFRQNFLQIRVILAISDRLNFPVLYEYLGLQEDDHERTALHVVETEGHVEVVDVLVAQKACVETSDAEQQSPIHLAASNGHVAVVLRLLNFGAKS